MKLNDYSSLLSELRKGERQRVYILTGERGLGKHSVLSAAAETIKETAPDATILSSIQTHSVFPSGPWRRPSGKALQMPLCPATR